MQEDGYKKYSLTIADRPSTRIASLQSYSRIIILFYMASLMGKQIDERRANILFLMRIVLASVQQLFRRFRTSSNFALCGICQ